MLTENQKLILFRGRHNANCLFSQLPKDMFLEIIRFCNNPDSDINTALKLVADGSEDEITLPDGRKTNAVALLLEMLEKNPRLLLEAGNVKTASGMEVKRVTIYEFCLGAGDPDLAKKIEPFFAKMIDEVGNKIDGETEHQRQYNRYKPHIDRLAEQIKSNTPTYNLQPLFEIIKKSSAADITEALYVNDTNRTATRNTELRKALAEFRKAVTPKKSITVGMHYEHYTTLIQSLGLLHDEWQELSNNDADYDKCRLIWRQIFGYLQRFLPRIDRFAFARSFADQERTPKFINGNGAFPDFSDVVSDFVCPGFDDAIYGRGDGDCWGPRPGGGADFQSTCQTKVSGLENLCGNIRDQSERNEVGLTL